MPPDFGFDGHEGDTMKISQPPRGARPPGAEISNLRLAIPGCAWKVPPRNFREIGLPEPEPLSKYFDQENEEQKKIIERCFVGHISRWWYNASCRALKGTWFLFDGSKAALGNKKTCSTRGCDYCDAKRMEKLASTIDATFRPVFENAGKIAGEGLDAVEVKDVLHLIMTLSSKAGELHGDAIVFATNYVMANLSRDDGNELNKTIKPWRTASVWETTLSLAPDARPPHKHRQIMIASQMEFGKARSLELSLLVHRFFIKALREFFELHGQTFDEDWVLEPRPVGFAPGCGRSREDMAEDGLTEGGTVVKVYSQTNGVDRRQMVEILKEYAKKACARGEISSDDLREVLARESFPESDIVNHHVKKMRDEVTKSRFKVSQKSKDSVLPRQALEILSYARHLGLMNFTVDIEYEDKSGRKHLQRWKSKDSLLWYRDNPFNPNWQGDRPMTFGAFPKGTVPMMSCENPIIQALYDRYEKMREDAKGTKAARVSSTNSKVLNVKKEEKIRNNDVLDTRVGRYEAEMKDLSFLTVTELDAFSGEIDLREIENQKERLTKTRLMDFLKDYQNILAVEGTYRFRIREAPAKIKSLEILRDRMLASDEKRKEQKAATIGRKIDRAREKLEEMVKKADEAESKAEEIRMKIYDFIKSWPEEAGTMPLWCDKFTRNIEERTLQEEEVPPPVGRVAGDEVGWLNQKLVEKLELQERARRRFGLISEDRKKGKPPG